MTPSRFEHLLDLLQQSCARHARRPLYGTRSDGGWSWTSYREFSSMVDACRAGLALLGVGPGDRVAVVSSNRLEWAVLAYATYGRGAALVPMYENQRPDEWEFIVADSGSTVLVASGRALDAGLGGGGRLPGVRHVIALDRPANGAESYASLLARGQARPSPTVAIQPGTPAHLVYTSGTTGKPKGVVLTHENLTSNVNAIWQVFPLEPSDRSLSFLPWAHIYGQLCEVHAMLSMGSSVALNDDLRNLPRNLTEVKPTILFAVPQIFNRIYAAIRSELETRPRFVGKMVERAIRTARQRRLGESVSALDAMRFALVDRVVFAKIRQRFGGRLRYAISGSAALSPEVAEFIDAVGVPVYEGYGLTETSALSTVNIPGRKRLGSVGRAVPGVSVEIARASGAEGDGEIVIRGPNVMQGYHARPAENAAAFTADGGLLTGDLGYVDADGYLYVTGRIKEQFKLENGKYVHPAVLEEQLKLSPFISNAFVYGENRPHCVALIVAEAEKVRRWVSDQGLQGEAGKVQAHVRELIRREIASRSEGFKGFERIKFFALLNEDFTTDNGMLTPTLKLKRRSVVAKHKDLIEGLYARPSREDAPAAHASPG